MLVPLVHSRFHLQTSPAIVQLVSFAMLRIYCALLEIFAILPWVAQMGARKGVNLESRRKRILTVVPHAVNDVNDVVLNGSIARDRAIQNLFFILIWYFLYNAIGYLLLFFVDQEMMAPMDTNYIIGMVIGTIGTYILWKYVIRQIPFPMRKHLLIFIALLVVYSVVMYLLVWLLNNFVQPIAAISMNFLGWSIVYWVISVAIFLARLYFYGHNPAVVSRV